MTSLEYINNVHTYVACMALSQLLRDSESNRYRAWKVAQDICALSDITFSVTIYRNTISFHYKNACGQGDVGLYFLEDTKQKGREQLRTRLSFYIGTLTISCFSGFSRRDSFSGNQVVENYTAPIPSNFPQWYARKLSALHVLQSELVENRKMEIDEKLFDNPELFLRNIDCLADVKHAQLSDHIFLIDRLAATNKEAVADRIKLMENTIGSVFSNAHFQCQELDRPYDQLEDDHDICLLGLRLNDPSKNKPRCGNGLDPIREE